MRKALSPATLAGLLAAALAAPAGAGEVNTGYFGNIAIEGYDPVAYFTEKRAVKGTEDYAHDWLGATWLFAQPEHRDLFAADPISYAPQYGGLCADGVAFGQKSVNIDPRAFRIIDGKLYLNYDESAAVDLETSPGRLVEAETNWPKIRADLLQN